MAAEDTNKESLHRWQPEKPPSMADALKENTPERPKKIHEPNLGLLGAVSARFWIHP